MANFVRMQIIRYIPIQPIGSNNKLVHVLLLTLFGPASVNEPKIEFECVLQITNHSIPNSILAYIYILLETGTHLILIVVLCTLEKLPDFYVQSVVKVKILFSLCGIPKNKKKLSRSNIPLTLFLQGPRHR